MLKTIIASQAAKAAALCVCPVIGAAVVTKTVPQVRKMVHAATAPGGSAVHKRRSRVAHAAPQPAVCPEPTPVVLSGGAPIVLPDTGITAMPVPVPSTADAVFTASRIDNVPISGGILGNPKGVVTPPAQPPVSGVPEVSTWAQWIIGFAMAGGALRASARLRSPKGADRQSG